MRSHRYVTRLFFAALIIVASPASVLAQVNFVQVQKMDFGKWFFDDNASQLTITVTPMGVVTSSPSLVMFRAPRPGIYNITGLPAFTTFNAVTVTINQPVILGGQTFDLQNFTTQMPDADAAGVTQLRLGGELTSSGDGQPYAGGVYDGIVDIEIDY